MRTTVTLDPDVEEAVRRLMAERGLSFKTALNEAIRLGLRRAEREPFRQRTRRMGVLPGVDLDKALALAAELEDQEIARRLREGR